MDAKTKQSIDLVNTAKLIEFPSSQICMMKDCPYLLFIDIIIDDKGSWHICTNSDSCPYNKCPAIKKQMVLTTTNQEERRTKWEKIQGSRLKKE